ncbi:MAG TPA: MerR family transcriptional regulator [Flavobacteriales bacterium]|nr:MerR family transcriptional regulator [Flavobacteriales bacterium]
MLIGQLAQRTGFTRDTIRFYEKHGLIEVPHKARRDNNYKEYPDAVLERLLAIKRIKGMGFTLNETQEILDLMDVDQATCSAMTSKLNEKVVLIEQKVAELIRLRETLRSAVKGCLDRCSPSANAASCGLVQ